MAIQLIGVSLSNYYNVVKLALLEKGIPFEEVHKPPSKDEDYLAISPMGKIPCIKTEDGYLSETLAILTYLERLQPEPGLLPNDPAEAGRAMQIFQFIDHYIDPCGRNVLGMAMFGQPVDEAKVAEQYQKLEFAARALEQVAQFDPFIAGPNLTWADLNAAVTISYVGKVTHMLSQKNPLTEIEGIRDYFARLATRPHFQKVYADRDATLKAMQEKA
jgi:glutathione S-transferase